MPSAVKKEPDARDSGSFGADRPSRARWQENASQHQEQVREAGAAFFGVKKEIPVQN